MGKESVISEKKAVARASVVHCGARYDYRGGLWQVGGGDFAIIPQFLVTCASRPRSTGHSPME